MVVSSICMYLPANISLRICIGHQPEEFSFSIFCVHVLFVVDGGIATCSLALASICCIYVLVDGLTNLILL